MTDLAEDALQLGKQTFADTAKGLHLEDLVPAPYSWILRLVAFLAPIALFAGVVFWIWHAGGAHQAAKDKPVIAAATRSADVAGFTAQGAQENAARVDAFNHFDLTVHDAGARAAAQAESAPDANQPLPLDRAARLAAADAELCRLQPDLCADAEVRNAGGVQRPGGS